MIVPEIRAWRSAGRFIIVRRVNAYEEIVNRSRDYITLINRDYVYEIANDAYCRQIGKRREEIVGRSVAEVWGEDRFVTAIKPHLDRCLRGEHVSYIDRFVFGEIERHINVAFYPYGPRDNATHVLVFSHDITRLSQVEQRLTSFEVRDPTTGLFNRRSLEIILEKEIEQASGAPRALLFFRLNNLDQIVDLHGYSVGDLILENTGLRILRCVQSTDYVFRFAGNEIAILITDIRDRVALAATATRIHDEVTLPYQQGEATITLGTCAGVAFYPDDGSDRDALVHNAHIAMSDAGRRRLPYVFFDAGLHRAVQSRLALGSEIGSAMRERQFRIHYQPIVNSRGAIVGAEALVRWQHPQRGMVMPAEIIPAATEAGLMISLGRFVLFEACEQVRAWSPAHKLFVTVNMTAREFLEDHTLEGVQNAIETSHIDPQQLKIEITESETMENPEAAVRTIQSLQRMGVDVLIDDFGTGQSSLANLRTFPARILKLDKSFTKDLTDSQGNGGGRSVRRSGSDVLARSISSDYDPENPGAEFLRHVVAALKSLRKTVLIEGIETAAEARGASRLGFDLMQGSFYGMAMSADAFADLVESGNR